MPPFKALYRGNPLGLLRFMEKGSEMEEVNDLIHKRNEILDKLKENLHEAQKRMKKLANKQKMEV